MFTLFFIFRSARIQHRFYFCFTNVCLLVFSILRFPLCKYPMKLFARVFRLFLRVFYFATVFPIFDDDFSLNECYACACQIQVRIRKKKLQNRLRRVLVFDTSRAFSLPVQKRGLVVRRVLVLIQVKGFLRGL